MSTETNTIENLILDLLDWVDRRARTYEEVLDAWHTSCPRLPVWEEANDRALLSVEERIVRLSPTGRIWLRERQAKEAADACR